MSVTMPSITMPSHGGSNQIERAEGRAIMPAVRHGQKLTRSDEYAHGLLDGTARKIASTLKRAPNTAKSCTTMQNIAKNAPTMSS